jgi:hypothetical protein
MTINTTAIREEAISIATSLRLGKNIEISEKIITLTHLFSSLALSLSPEQLGTLQALLSQLLAAQERQDWLGMADDLEYDIIDFLDSLSKKN